MLNYAQNKVIFTFSIFFRIMITISNEIANQILEETKKSLSRAERELKRSKEDMTIMSSQEGKDECQSLIYEYEALVLKYKKWIAELTTSVSSNPV
jgi:DNA-binding transcriptional regulator GbsR (MarR family)